MKLCVVSGCGRYGRYRGLCLTHERQRRTGKEPGAVRIYVKDPVASFWKRVTKIDGGCWEWTGATIRGYGRCRDQVFAHRRSWELHFGAIPDAAFVCHRCDNPPCVRPDHLFLGTQSDNMRDCAAKGRTRGLVAAKGSSNPRARISEHDVTDIRTLYAFGATQQALAEQFGLTQANVSCIVLRQTWRHVT